MNEQLLDGLKFRQMLEQSLACPHPKTVFVSAFIKANALERLLERCTSEEIIVVARWRVDDLLSGASDLDCFKICQKYGAKFGIDQNLHAKVYLAGDKIFIGSSNLTDRGMSLSNDSNLEVGTIVPISGNKLAIQKLFAGVCWLDNYLFEKIATHIRLMTGSKKNITGMWPGEIQDELNRSEPTYWFADFVSASPNEILNSSQYSLKPNVSATLNLLDLKNQAEVNVGSLKQAFLSSRSQYWLEQKLPIDKEYKFGDITDLLHNSLNDKILPYRSEIKEIVAILFDWMVFVETHFVYKRPNRSQIIRRVK